MVYHNLNNRQHVCTWLSNVLIFVILCIIVVYMPATDINFTIIYLTQFFCGLYLLWQSTSHRLTPFILLYFSSGLFLGGQFFAHLLDVNCELWQKTFFQTYSIIDEERAKETTIYLISFTSISTFAYTRKKLNRRTLFNSESLSKVEGIRRFLSILFWFLLVSILIDSIIAFQRVLQYGYVSLYVASQNEEFQSNGIFYILRFVCFGLAFAYGDTKLQKRYVIMFIINATIGILIGGRGAFGALLLFSVWMYSLKHKLKLKKMLLSFILCGGVLISVFSFSIRGKNDLQYSGNALEIASTFLSEQGVSLVVFDLSRSIEDYPILPYFQSIIPMSSRIYSIVSGEILYQEDVSFQAHMNKSVNQRLFASGAGLGWSILSDVYLFSGRSFFIYCILSYLFGWVCRFLEEKAQTSAFAKGILFTIIFPLIMLPRSNLSTVMPLIIYYAIICGFLFLIQNSMVRYTKHPRKIIV